MPPRRRRFGNETGVARWSVTYVWESPNGYQWDWQNGTKADQSQHFCTRLAFFDPRDALIETKTMVCSVMNKGRMNAVSMFGNPEVADKICRADSVVRQAMDAHAAAITGRNKAESAVVRGKTP